MEFKKKNKSISKWLSDRAGLNINGVSPTRYLAESNGLTTQAIYNYVDLVNKGQRDIRVIGDKSPEIYEVRRLGK